MVQLARPALSIWTACMLLTRGSAWQAAAASQRHDELIEVWLEGLLTDMACCRNVAALTVAGGGMNNIF